MLDFLFPRLTRAPNRGEALFDAITRQARQTHWYVEGQIEDTIDGRFNVLATITALTAVRLESGGGEGAALSVALTERFIEVMEAEHREIGLGDPSLGRKVRKLVGSLARRVELWRAAVTADDGWAGPTRESLHPRDSANAAVEHNAQALQRLWGTLQSCDLAALASGQIG